MKKTALSIGLGLILASSLAGAASPTNNGSNPKGKPFIEIQGQIVEVEGVVSDLADQVDGMVADFDTLEGRITANEAAVASLQTQSSSLQAQIDTNADSVAAVMLEIDALQANNVDMQQQLLDLGGTDDYLEGLIQDNEAAIVTLQGSLDTAVIDLMARIATLESNLSDLESDMTTAQVALADLETDTDANADAIALLDTDITGLQSQINDNEMATADLQATLDSSVSDLQGQIDDNSIMISMLESDIALMQADLDMKQNRVNGNCPNGTAAVEIREDGSMVCDPISGSTGNLISYTAYNYLTSMAPYTADGVYVYCGSGYRASGGGFWGRTTVSSPIIDVYASAPSSTTGWLAFGVNRTATTQNSPLYAYVVCMKIQ